MNELWPFLVNYLKKKYGEGCKITVRCKKLKEKDVAGYCSETDYGFAIEIDENLRMNEKVGVLVHEFAHVVSWNKSNSDHDNNFQYAFNKIRNEVTQLLISCLPMPPLKFPD